MNLSDPGQGADVFAVLLRREFQRFDIAAEMALAFHHRALPFHDRPLPFDHRPMVGNNRAMVRNHQFDSLSQGLVTHRETVQPFIDSHTFSVAKRTGRPSCANVVRTNAGRKKLGFSPIVQTRSLAFAIT